MSPTTTSVLAAVLECADGAPTIGWLCRYLDKPHETVRRHLKALEGSGLLSLFWSHEKGHGVYRVVATPRGRAAAGEVCV